MEIVGGEDADSKVINTGAAWVVSEVGGGEDP